MRFEALDVSGAALIKLERHTDERGFFARSMCAQELRAHGLPDAFVQESLSWTDRRGTVRGLHFQWPPSREGKLVRCVRGAIYDVMLDLRPAEPTYLRHRAFRLDQDNRDAVFIPAGVAHGFQTLTDDCDVWYEMTEAYAPELATGVRWNDPAFGIRWPITDAIVIAKRDAEYPDFHRRHYEAQLARRARVHRAGKAARWT
jgi:dTDP-4-dehydrorhamnose 3,5-epimerase